MRQPLLLTALLMALSFCQGCAVMNNFSPYDVRGGTWKHIRTSGVASDASHSKLLDTIEIEGKRNYFSAEDEKVTYWAHFAYAAFWSPYHVSFHIRWYDPQGNIFFEEQFPLNSIYDAAFVKASLPLKDSPALHFPGLWQVELFYKGYSIDRKSFHIVPADASAYQPPARPPAVSNQSSDIWKAVMRNSPVVGDPFEARMGEAEALFNQGRFGEAKTILEAILADEPHRTEAHVGLAAIYHATGDVESALKELDYALQNPKYREQAYELRTRILESEGVNAS